MSTMVTITRHEFEGHPYVSIEAESGGVIDLTEAEWAELAAYAAGKNHLPAIHHIADGSATTSCCGRTPFELPIHPDRLTQDPAEVTCQERTRKDR